MLRSRDNFTLSHLSHRQILVSLAVAVLMSVLWPGPVFGMFGIASLMIYFRNKAESLGDTRIFRIFATGLALRGGVIVIFSLLSIFLGTVDFVLFGDSRLNFDASFKALLSLNGTLNYTRTALQPGIYGYSAIHWLRGAIYFIAGYSPFLIRLLNVVIACLVAWMIYLISFRITGHKTVSAWAMGLTMFWPSNILWSVELLKEPLIQLYSSVVIYLFVDMLARRKWHYLFLLAFIWFPLGHLRKGFDYVMLATLIVSVLLFLPRRPLTGLIVLIFLALAAAWKTGPARLNKFNADFQYTVISTQIGFATTGGSYYQFIPERFSPRTSGGSMTPVELGLSYLKSLFYYLGVPKPYTLLSVSKIPTLPQMVTWYLMLILFLPQGVLYLLRYHQRSAGVVLVFLFLALSVSALFTGNEGTAFRQRDVLTPFIFIPVSVGILNFRGWLALNYGWLQEKFSPAMAKT